MNKVVSVAAIMASTAALTIAASFAYKTVAPSVVESECVIQAGRSGGEGVDHAIRACRDRFSAPPADVDEIPFLEAILVDGKAGYRSGDTFSATFYNGSENYAVTRIQVSIVDPETAEKDEEDRRVRQYHMNVNIPPLSSRTHQISVFETFDRAIWNIDRVWGYRADS